MSLLCLLFTFWLDRGLNRVMIRRAERVLIRRSAMEYLRWVCTVFARQTRMFWCSFFLNVCFYTGFYTFVSFTAYVLGCVA